MKDNMNLPKILVKGKFRPADLVVSVSPSTRKIDSQIENQLDGIWEEKLKKAQEKGQNCYNGLSYRLNSIEQQDKVILDFGILEYKVRDGLIAIPEYFNLPEEYYRKGCFTCSSIRTSDDKYLMAELSGKSMNPNKVDLIGGVMETNIPMTLGDDIFESLYAELFEEAGIEKSDISDCYLQTIYLAQGTNIAFYFETILNIDSTELLERFKKTKMQILSLFAYIPTKNIWKS